MPDYEIRVRDAASGKLRKRVRTAFDEADLAEWLAREGIVAERVALRPFRPATERQRDYMKVLDLTVPDGLSLDDASAMIQTHLDRETRADADDLALAREMRVAVSPYDSRLAVYRQVTAWQVGRGDRALAQWFVWRVWRDGRDRAHAPDLRSGARELSGAVDAVLGDQRALRSLHRAARETRVGFRWFGDFSGHRGDSNATAAYLCARAALRAGGLLPAPSSAPPQPVARHNPGPVAVSPPPKSWLARVLDWFGLA